MAYKTFRGLRKGRTDLDYIYHYNSPLGRLTAASDGRALIGLWFDGQKYFADTLGKETQEKMLPVFEETGRWLEIYFGGRKPDFTPELSMRTTQFRRAVWEILLKIPYPASFRKWR